MQTIICKKPNKFKKIYREKPSCGLGEALVEIKRIGICGTDLHAFRGKQPYFTYPRVLGHELSGIVKEMNPSTNKEGIKVGDQVSVIPYLECGNCPACKSGKTNCCSSLKVLGVHQDGGMSDYINIPINHLIETNGLPLDEAALIEPLSIGAHAVRRSKLQNKENALVIGAGPIGLSVMIFARQIGANVIAMDLNEERLEFVKNNLNIDTMVPCEHDVEKLRKLLNGNLPDIVFDATGNVHSMNSSFKYPEQGGKLIFVGLVNDYITFSDPEFHRKELTLLSSRNATKEDFLYVKHALQEKIININGFITHRSPFSELVTKFEDWLKPDSKVIKAIVER